MTSREAAVDSVVLKFARDMVPVLLIVLMATVSLEAFFIKSNADSLHALQSQTAILQQSQAQQAIRFETFLQEFTIENDFDCRVLWYLNTHDVNVPVAPPISVCSVVAP